MLRLRARIGPGEKQQRPTLSAAAPMMFGTSSPGGGTARKGAARRKQLLMIRLVKKAISTGPATSACCRIRMMFHA
jgi:hypothetical protein